MAPGDEFGDLLGQIQTLTTQLATLISKSEFVTRDITSLCEDRKHIEGEIAEIKEKLASLKTESGAASIIRKDNSDRIVYLQRQVAILETKADYAKTTCDGLVTQVSSISQITWKIIGFAAGVAFVVSLATPWIIKIIFP